MPTANVVQSKALYELGHADVPRLIWKNFMPAFVGVVVSALYNIVDRIFIGQEVGPFALAGLSAVFPIMLLQQAFAMLIGLGSSVRVSLSLGEHNPRRAQRFLGSAVALSIIVGAGITILGFAIRGPMLRLFGVQPQTMEFALQYVDVILVGNVFHLVGFSLNNIMRAEGNPHVSMYSMIVAALVNVALDALFILVFRWGVMGAAVATVIAQLTQALWGIAHFCSGRCVVRLHWPYVKFSWQLVLLTLSVGFAPFALQVAGSFVQGVYNIQLVKYGNDIAISAMAIINSVSMLLIMSVVSLNMAAQPVYGYNCGAKLYRRLRQALLTCIVAASAIAFVGFACVQLMPGPIIRLFESSDAELLRIGERGMRVFFACFPVVGMQIVLGNYFQSIGKPAISALIALLRQLIFLVPLILILPLRWGFAGVWMAAPVSDVISATVCGVFFLREFRRLSRLVEAQEEAMEGRECAVR